MNSLTERATTPKAERWTVLRIRSGEVIFESGERLKAPFHWRNPRHVTVGCDLFYPEVPFEFVDRVFAVLASTGPHAYCIPTAFPERAAEYLQRVADGAPQAAADYRRRQDEYRAQYWDPETALYYGEGSPAGPPTPELRFIYDSATLQEQRDPSPSGTGRMGFSGGEYHWRQWPLTNVRIEELAEGGVK